MKNLNGVCALVSGGASAVGSEVIRELVNRGASVLAVDSTEERIEEAIAKLDLENPDEIFTHALEGGDLVSWWDLGNLIAAYFHTLNLFVHVAEPTPSVPARTLGLDALREAEKTSCDSFLTAVARLEKYLVAASEEDEVGANVVAVQPSAGDRSKDEAPGSVCHAMSLALAEALTREYAEADLNIRVHAVRPHETDASDSAVAIADVVGL